MKPNLKIQRARLDERVKLFLQLLGELINARRLELKMSQATVAEMAGLSRTAVYNIEHGLVDERSTTLMRVAWKQKIQIRDQKEAAWDMVITARANNCEAVTPTDLAALQSTGFPLRSTGGPIGDLPAPGDLRAVPLDFEGQVDLRCKSVKGAGSYEWECKLHSDAGVWAQVKISLGASIRVTGLTPLAQYAFRVRAIGSAGPGAWSDEVVVRAP